MKREGDITKMGLAAQIEVCEAELRGISAAVLERLDDHDARLKALENPPDTIAGMPYCEQCRSYHSEKCPHVESPTTSSPKPSTPEPTTKPEREVETAEQIANCRSPGLEQMRQDWVDLRREWAERGEEVELLTKQRDAARKRCAGLELLLSDCANELNHHDDSLSRTLVINARNALKESPNAG